MAPVAADGVAVRAACEQGHPLGDALTDRAAAVPGSPAATLRFVSQSDLPVGMAYEQHIFDTGRVPTREGLHDFFNGLCWIRFPATKRRLNQLQAGEINSAGGVGQLRGPVRDALTLFDENAALLQAPDALWQALLQREWQRLFVELRPLWAQARLVLVGHALMEKLVSPYKSITAHVYRATVPLELGADLAAWDTWVAGQLDPVNLATKPFTPLPVLGVPGWWAANEDAGFYDDASVFRAPRV
ncbi:DUF3025 domain-containing protein [Hydrogenophaga sp. PAMC20947]|uniref:DUF3025 domain-containing protein n=1 Tax=Hydrogenophaga sp. PAMC20947 TaxID=2565558 RepID=UPI001FF78C4A|nr:DUF3025 domain-containing protein [Hydrogenophaga sp. PAMC20947]